jgi:hypothetical protein
MSEAPKPIIDLIERFERNVESYHNTTYNETQVRQEFINPFFEALGWDITNKAGHAEAYKDVIHEDAIKIGSATKAPDYCFRIGGARKFFLEAKKPSVSIKDDLSPAYQLRRYAWSAKLPLSILTDFEEFAVYDSRITPRPNDKPSVGRLLYLTYKEYTTRWEEIASIFSKDAVLKGSFDKFALSRKGKRGTSEVDAEFLTEIETWRNSLAHNLALRNPKLTVGDLNFSVQRTIDRIIFLRMCEDRGIEPYGQLQSLLNGENTYDRLRHFYVLADDRYNSGIFHFKPEKGRAESPDELTPSLTIDDKVLKDIIRRLYYPESPYEFSVLSADILGNVYEQFLGKVIRLTTGHRAVIEEKPEVKKAGGVYYTPAHIVEYIVKNTVGKLCEDKTPKQIAKLKFLDPACGSGSFLIGAYSHLLSYHRDWYVKDGHEKHTKEIYQGAGGQWFLTTQEKKRILLNNIYGVDIDSQAVEVTKLSLLLKVLEGENQDSLTRQLKMWRERALPDLGNNIKCGNSLIGPDYFSGQLLPDEDEMRRVNPFNWKAEFQEIMKVGGFDAVIGNPPYVRIQAMKEWAPLEVELYKQHYSAAGKGSYDIYVVFVEKGFQLLNKTGRLGFILPHKFFNAQYGEPLRKLISQGRHLAEVVHFGDQQVFTGATTYTCLLFLEKRGTPEAEIQKVKNLEIWKNAIVGAIHELPLLTSTETGHLPAKAITAAPWNFTVGGKSALFEKLSAMQVRLGNLAHIFVGTQTSADDVYVLDECRYTKNHLIGISKSLGKEVRVEASCTKPFLRGKDIRRYEFPETNACLICPYEITKDDCRLFTAPEIQSKFPLAMSYLEANKEALMKREKGKFNGQNWYAFGYPKSMPLFQKPKIVVPDYNNVASFTFDSHGNFYKTGYGVILKDTLLSPMYVLGLLNSPLLFKYLLSIGTSLRGGYVRFWTQFIEQLPIRAIDFSDPSDKARHDKMVSLVERMLDLHKRLSAAKTPDDKTRLQRQIDATDKEIDQLVYKLYGLTEEEIGIVEGRA